MSVAKQVATCDALVTAMTGRTPGGRKWYLNLLTGMTSIRMCEILFSKSIDALHDNSKMKCSS